ncbi:calcium/proton exchanger [Cryptococcus depauperatus CBS 7841]|uniref:Calcium/proton exchanger n=1 Tax=Cryptococcus depauperatus CBS 7841 TaxID=1295531 RepID=A0A1E3IXH8_9TREE|nr:calcium/proton exchanger [Cryptococcus depauperatus CBS 7841]
MSPRNGNDDDDNITNFPAPGKQSTASEVFAATMTTSPTALSKDTRQHPPEMKRSNSGQQQRQQELGKGKPSRGNLRSQTTSPHAARPVLTPTRTSFSSVEDSSFLDPATVPRTALPSGAFESTPRNAAWGGNKGMPHTAFVGSFGSPTAFFNQSNKESQSGSQRIGRGTKFAPSREPFQPINQAGSSSRSVSRARPALLHNPSGAREMGNEDDEDLQDRGAELIKQRQRERRAKKKKQQEYQQRRWAEEGISPETSNPPTGIPVDGFTAQQGGLQRTLGITSKARNASVSRRSTHEGGYFPRSGNVSGAETPYDGALSPRDNQLHAPSLYSSAAEEDDDGDDRASLLGEIVNDVVEEETGGCNSDEDEEDEDADDGVTVRDRQDAINIEHPFGLPIWKPALYHKSRSVTRNAESALHSIPSAAAESHLLPGNILWIILFGWWLALACFIVAIVVSGAEAFGGGRGGYGTTLRGLAWYIGWPFGKYVEGEGGPPEDSDDEETNERGEEQGRSGYGAVDNGSPVSKKHQRQVASDASSSNKTLRRASNGAHPEESSQPRGISTSTNRANDRHGVSFASGVKGKDSKDERMGLFSRHSFRRPRNKRANMYGRLVYWPVFFLVVAPVMLFVCILCWSFVITIPMAKLSWKLINLLWYRPLEINFRSAPKIPVPSPSNHLDGAPQSSDGSASATVTGDSPTTFTLKRARLTAGQVAPTSGPTSTVLLCTYRAVGLQYYKYTVGGVNILFINLLPLVFFTIVDGLLILPAVERNEHLGRPISPFLRFITSQALIFILALASVIPLSYFIGMAVASISAQSSIGMGAVINATFGSIIEIILYSIALTQGKGRLVEGSIIGSILAGVLLMPGASMCSSALKRKEQKFNAKSAGVTSTMLIMAIIGTLTPTMFYQTYGSFELHCNGCPDNSVSSTDSMMLKPDNTWACKQCYYKHPDPEKDPFYQENVKTLMYGCAAILVFSYMIGLWFSLRTHAAQIWQNPQQLMRAEEVLGPNHPAVKATLAQRLTPQALAQHLLPLHKQAGAIGASPVAPMGGPHAVQGGLRLDPTGLPKTDEQDAPPTTTTFHSHGHQQLSNQPDTARPGSHFVLPGGYTPYLESIDQASRSTRLSPMRLPSSLTTEDFTRAVAVATVSALRHQGSIVDSDKKHRTSPIDGHAGVNTVGIAKDEDHGKEHGGHEAPSWTRDVSAGVLLACTLLYAIIAEILVDVVDVVLKGSGIDEKFLGLTLFALVPNTTEFMNAMSFALNGNIALSMEIGSAYALQVCLLQIPAMVAFSALYGSEKMGDVINTFTLIFPRWDVIAIILSIFLLTYTYIEARSNYHRGSILVLAYVVLIMGFYYAPPRGQEDSNDNIVFKNESLEGFNAGISTAISKLWG